MTLLVLTVLGDDHSGLVAAVAAPVEAHGGSWRRSQLARMAGKFAGIVEVEVPCDRVEALEQALSDLDGLSVTVEASEVLTPPPDQRWHLHLLGQDRSGIVAEISGVLADHGVGIEELSTDVHEAAMSGGMLFEADAALLVPGDVDEARLRAELERLADELMVDLVLADGDVVG